MGIVDEILSKLKLVEIKAEFKPEGEQVGIVNIKNVETNQTINLHFHVPDPETARALGESISGKLPELEMQAKKDTKRELERDPIRTVVNSLSPSTQEEFIAKTMGASAVGGIRLPGLKVKGYGVTEFVAGKIEKKEG